MTALPWPALEALFHEALACAPAERAAFLAERCADSPELRAQLEAMLRAHDERASALNVSGVSAPSVLTPGSRLGTYEILGTLGAGGMGEVYRAHDTRLHRDVAIKILPAAFMADVDRAARFEREARVLAALNHPNIAAIYGIEDGPAEAGHHVRALVLELVEGETLADRLARGPIPVTDALGIARQIAEGLEAAHEKGIVHRDLKPANFKITPGGAVKVLDFGLAKLAQASGLGPQASDLTASPTITVDRTHAGLITGTPAYMSPEQARGQAVDKRTDIWAFGCVLYEMLTGRLAFQGDTFSDTIATILEREPDLMALPTSTPPALQHLLRRCLKKEPKDRLHDVADARIEIQESATNPALPTAALRAASRPAARERLAWIVAAVAALAAAVSLTLTLPSVLRSSPQPPPLRVEITTPPTTDALSLSLSPDGQKLVFVADSDGVTRLWLRELHTTPARPLAGSDGASFPFWSPDSRSIGFFAEGKLKRLDLPGGPAQVLADAPIGRGGTWNRDGVILFAANTDVPIIQMPAGGGEAVAVTRRQTPPPEVVGHRFPQFLPDGRRFVFHVVGSPAHRGVYVASLDSPALHRLIDTETAALVMGEQLLFLREGTLFAQRFHTEELTLSGNPVPIADDIALSGGLNVAAVTASSAGPIAYRSGASAGRRQFVWFDRSGHEVGRVGDPDAENPNNPQLSPDGRRLALNRTMNGQADIWVMDMAQDALSRLTFESVLDAYPVWSPDGQRIAYGSNRRGMGAELYVKPASGAGPEEPLPGTLRNMAPMDWSLDGRFLLYRTEGAETGYDLWALPMNGDRKPFPVVETNVDERDGQFSPDGRWIAYESNESGRFEIYVQSFPAGSGKWQISNAGGAQVRWRRDGRELFYVALDGRLMAVSFRTGADGRTVESGIPVQLFSTRIPGGAMQGGFRQQYVVSRDGQRFLINSLIPTAVAPITLLLNWRPTP